MLDITLFRVEKGGTPDVVRESEKRRFHADADELVDATIALDESWRKLKFELDELNKEFSRHNKLVAAKKKAKEDASELIAQVKAIAARIATTKGAVADAAAALDQQMRQFGNLVHDSVPVSRDEADNAVVRVWGDELRRVEADAAIEGPAREPETLLRHDELLYRIAGYEPEKGSSVAGHAGYFLTGPGYGLNAALVRYGMDFLAKRGFRQIQVPFFMRPDAMRDVAQLTQYEEELYKVVGGADEAYLIATSEQPLAAFHRGDWIDPKDAPLKYAGCSTCFRKEAGAAGKHAAGVFRVHQFEKVEQFVVTSPLDDASWRMHEELIHNAEEFYMSLGLPYRVVTLVSGELNQATAKKYDLEAWFPVGGTYRELVSCSNCTDYQSRRVECRFGKRQGKQAGQEHLGKLYAHMLNSTLVASERALCCLLETYQTPEGVRVPEVLQPYMGGVEFIPFTRDIPRAMIKQKEKSAAGQKKKTKDKKKKKKSE